MRPTTGMFTKTRSFLNRVSNHVTSLPVPNVNTPHLSSTLPTQTSLSQSPLNSYNAAFPRAAAASSSYSSVFAQIAASSTSSSSSSSSASSSCTPPKISPGSWMQSKLKAHLSYHRKREATEKATATVRTREDVFFDPLGAQESGGDARLDRLNWWLNNIGDPSKPDEIIVRSPDQKIFHEHFTNACLAKIFGDREWNQHSKRVMQSRGLHEIRYEVTAITPRRWGKTWSVAMFVLGLMLSVPGIKICVFSTGQRASNSLMEIMKQYIAMIPGIQERIVKENEEVRQKKEDDDRG